MGERASTDGARKRPWVRPELEELGLFTELTRLQTTAECNTSDLSCQFFPGMRVRPSHHRDPSG